MGSNKRPGVSSSRSHQILTDTDLGFLEPKFLRDEAKKNWNKHQRIPNLAPFEELEVVQDGPSQFGKCINVDEPFVSYTNRFVAGEHAFNMGGDSTAPEVPLTHIADHRGLEISFQRTVRMPDDDRLHQLPDSMGMFPLYNVQDYAERLPSKIVNDGGLFLPMWQREALWVLFRSNNSSQKYALRVFVGRVNAISGKHMDEGPQYQESGARLQDYAVVPGQKWLDGICVAPGVVRQFVAMPLGSGYTVEGQKTGEEKEGGLQIEVTPAYQRGLRKWLRADRSLEDMKGSLISDLRSGRILDEAKSPAQLDLRPGNRVSCHHDNAVVYAEPKIVDVAGIQTGVLNLTRLEDDDTGEVDESLSEETEEVENQTENEEYPDSQTGSRNLKAMGLAAGGKLVQDIYKDPYPAGVWNTEATKLINVHILDPVSCEAVTHVVPPPPPMDVREYADAQLPFYVVNEQVDNRVDGGDFDNVSSVAAMDQKVGLTKEPNLDPGKPVQCRCEIRLCDCVIRPCGHQFCNVCIRGIDKNGDANAGNAAGQRTCPSCLEPVSHVAGFSAPMNIPGEETLKVRVPVHVLDIQDGRVRFESVQTTRV